MDKVIVTLVGLDHPGIIAATCSYFADNDINILDIRQTTVDGFINMMMIVDIDGFKGRFDELCAGLDKVGERVKVQIKAQREDIIKMMYRV